MTSSWKTCIIKANVLLSNALQPLLIDFGLSRQTIASLSGKATTSIDLAGSVRWMATEFFHRSASNLDRPGMKANKATDVWAYGMTVLVRVEPRYYFPSSYIRSLPKELLTGDVPYKNLRDFEIILSVANYTLPSAPTDLGTRPRADRKLWELCLNCWQAEPYLRPSLEEIRSQLGKIDKVTRRSFRLINF